MLLVVSVEISALPENEEFLLISVNIRGYFWLPAWKCQDF